MPGYSSARSHRMPKVTQASIRRAHRNADAIIARNQKESMTRTTNTFHFRSYQREDLARTAIHDGAIIAWDPGLGKTMAMFSWPFLKGSRRTLIVAPAALHQQIITEGREKFRCNVMPITDQECALSLMRSGSLPLPGAPAIEPDPTTQHMPTFFITDYRWLGYNGGDEWSTEGELGIMVSEIQRSRRMAYIARHFGMPQDALTIFDRCLVRSKDQAAHAILGVPQDAPRSAIKTAYRNLARLTHPDLHPEDPKATERMQRLNEALDHMLSGDTTAIVKGIDFEAMEAKPSIDELMAGIGHVRKISESHQIRCLFAPTLSSIIEDCFDCVVADESVRLKSGEESYIATGVLRMKSRFRLALTGTPIKNRLPDIFHLASWVCGTNENATARWPYGNTSSHKASFASNHLVIEENLTKTERSRRDGNFRRYIKQTSKITNIHRLWKLLGPVVARRRKDQIGNDIVAKIIHPIRVSPGTEQMQTYRWHLTNPPEAKTPVAALGAQLQNLRMAALCPWATSLSRAGQPLSKSPTKWSPKIIAILSLAADLMEKSEQLVVFSPFQEFSTALKAALEDARVPALLLDGRVKNTRRGELAAEFKARKYPVLIAGIDAMGEGHSFECASHLVMPSLSWAYDANRQAIDRVHRLTSRKDVTIYLMITKGSIDERLTSLFQEKGDASDLALDGRLFDEDNHEVSLAELLKSASLDFDPSSESIPETSLVSEWEQRLRNRLRSAASRFTSGSTAIASTHTPQKPAIQPMPPKPQGIHQPDMFDTSKIIMFPATNKPSTESMEKIKQLLDF